MRTSAVPDRAAFAQTANKDETAGMSPMEMAKVDAQVISDADMSMFSPSEDGNIAAKSNRDFINRFVSKLGIAEAAGYLTADGRATKRLVDRIQAAVVEKAYHDDYLLEMVAEEPDPDLRNILTALTFAAGEFAKAKAIDQSLGGINIPSHAIAAGKLVRRARDEGMTLNELLGQLGLFENIPEATKGVAKFIDEHIRRGKRMSVVFRESARYLKEYLLNKEQGSLFGDEGVTLSPSDIIGRAITKLDGEGNGRKKESRQGEGSLFEAGRDYEESNREGEPGGNRGRGPYRSAGGVEEILEAAHKMTREEAKIASPDKREQRGEDARLIEGKDIGGQEKADDGAKKEPWEMTRGEYNTWYAKQYEKEYGREYAPEGMRILDADNMHIFEIRQALSEGKPVPAEVLKDYPDILTEIVVHDKEIRTKIARKGRNAQRYVEGQILKVRPDHEASRSGTLGGNTEIASTHNEVTVNNIPPNSSDVKVDKVDKVDWKAEILNARFLSDIEEVFRKVFNLQ